MTKNAFILNFLKLYNILWLLALPFLKKNRRIKKQFQKYLDTRLLEKTDIWIQAASAGEALLAIKIIRQLNPSKRTRILLTATTRQGLDLLESFTRDRETSGRILLQIAWFPFDKPDIIDKFILSISPKVVVLLETELWPAMLYFLKQYQIKTMVINARLSNASFKGYSKTKFLWRHLSPDRILATSPEDADRYRSIFHSAAIEVMPNIKFDTIDTSFPTDYRYYGTDIRLLIDTRAPFTILASVREEEENDVIKIIHFLTTRFPTQTIGLFPRHMHRLDIWKEKLSDHKINWQLKSKIGENQISFKVILWDTFGELNKAYELATCAFIGGSLAPLGGQNFIEPLTKGVFTITGPHLDDFKWVKPDIFTLGIVVKKNSWEAVARKMVSILKTPPDRNHIKTQALNYIKKNQGGTQKACDRIMAELR